MNGIDFCGNNIYLTLFIRKGGEIDNDGNYLIEVEASNENLDLQGQIVLQSALIESKDHFLRNGVISFDHLHKRKGPNGNVISDLSMIIGEPIEVRTEGKKTIVKGKLYHTKEAAQELIKMLKAASTRVKASVGGIWPQVIKDAESGAEKVAHFLWNDLALTISPVNNTVSAAYFAKSYDTAEFVKALMAGSGTDHSEFTGGRSMMPEDTETYTYNATETDAGYEEFKDKILSLIAALKTGEVQGEEEAVKFLVRQGVHIEYARATVREILLQGGKK
jgi:uncharacterized protein YegP (UPF0339 family)